MNNPEENGVMILAREAKKYVPAVGVITFAIVALAMGNKFLGGAEKPCIDGFAAASLNSETNKITVIASYAKDNVPSPESLIECALWAPDDTNLDRNPWTSTVGKALDNLGISEPVMDYMSDDAIVKRSPVAAEVIVNFPPQKVFEDVLSARRKEWWKKLENTTSIILDGVAVMGALWLVLKARSFRRSLRG